MSYASPELPSKSLAAAVSFVSRNLGVLFQFLWIDFVSQWLKINLATIFQLNISKGNHFLSSLLTYIKGTLYLIVFKLKVLYLSFTYSPSAFLKSIEYLKAIAESGSKCP